MLSWLITRDMHSSKLDTALAEVVTDFEKFYYVPYILACKPTPCVE